MCFGCSKEPSHRDGSFKFPQYMFWMRNKENSFPIRTRIWRSAHCLWGFYIRSMFGYKVLSVLSRFCNHLDGEERAGCL